MPDSLAHASDFCPRLADPAARARSVARTESQFPLRGLAALTLTDPHTRGSSRTPCSQGDSSS